MSEVTRTDIARFQDQLNDYRRRAEESQETADLEVEIAKKKNEDEINQLQRSQEQTLRDREVDLENTLENYRENSRESAARAQDTARAEIAKVKHQVYDRLGRSPAQADAEERMKQASRELELLADQNDDRLESLRRSQERQHQVREEDHARELEDVADQSRMAAKRDIDYVTQQFNDDLNSEKAELHEQYAEMAARVAEDKDLSKKEALHAMEQNAENYRRLSDKVERNNSNRLQSVIRGMEKKSQRQLLSQQKGFQEEAAELRRINNELMNLKPEFRQGYSEGRVEAIEDLEKESRMERERLVDSFEQALEAQEARSDRTESYLTEAKNQALIEQEGHFRRLISKQNDENNEFKQDLLTEFEVAHKALDENRRKDRELNELRLDRSEERGRESREAALTQQAESYNRLLSRNQTEMRAANQALSDELTRLKTSPRIDDISPAAERRMLEMFNENQEKTFGAEAERNERALASIRQSYQRKYEDVTRDTARQLYKMNREKTIAEDGATQNISEIVQDRDAEKGRALDDQRRDFEDQQYTLQRSYSKQMDYQRQLQEDKYDILKRNHEEEIQAVRSELDFRERELRRENSFALNEKEREMERMIRGLQEDHKLEREELMAQSRSDLDQQATQFNRELQKQKLDFDRQIAQLTAQSNEAKRVMASNYEEKIDEMRRSNERLLRQKS